MTSKQFTEDHLNKYFDDDGRIARIEFILSGNSVNIQYFPDGFPVQFPHVDTPPSSSDFRVVIWSTGQTYLTWKETDGSFHFKELLP